MLGITSIKKKNPHILILCILKSCVQDKKIQIWPFFSVMPRFLSIPMFA